MRGGSKEITPKSGSKRPSSMGNGTRMSSPTDTIRKDYIRKEDVHRKSKRVLYTQDEIDSDCCLSTEVPGMRANVRPPHVVAAEPTECLGENRVAGEVDWGNVPVHPGGDDGAAPPMGVNMMCAVLGIRDDGEDSESDEEEGTVEDQESGDDEIDEELNDEAGIPVDDLGVEVEEMKHDHEYPIISVGTEFRSMHEFRMSFRHFCIKGEFDVYRLKNSAERYEAVCKLTWMNGRAEVHCPWRITARSLPASTAIRVLGQ